MSKRKISKCSVCDGKVALVENKVVYGMNYGWPWIYLCQSPECRAYVGCHANTYHPLGTLADGRTRSARKAAYAALREYCDLQGMSHTDGRGWAAQALGVPEIKGGVGWLTLEQCKQLIDLCKCKGGDYYRVKGLAQISNIRELYFGGSCA